MFHFTKSGDIKEYIMLLVLALKSDNGWVFVFQRSKGFSRGEIEILGKSRSHTILYIRGSGSQGKPGK